MTAGERLAEALADAEHRGDKVPCSSDPAWISEALEDRREAARRCTSCPVTSLCAAAAVEMGAVWGVWASVDYGDKAQRRAAMRAGAA